MLLYSVGPLQTPCCSRQVDLSFFREGNGSSATLDGCRQACSSGAALVRADIPLKSVVGAQGPREMGLLLVNVPVCGIRTLAA